VSRALGALLLYAVAGWAQAQTTPEALEWLRRIYHATENLSYTGVFVYQQGDRTETSRVTHLAGAEGGVEKVEVLDGTPREILRTRDEIRCYLPESRTVKVERRGDTRGFPALLPERVSGLAEHYVITLGETRRVAGYDCRASSSRQRTTCATATGCGPTYAAACCSRRRLSARPGETLEQFTFTQLEIGDVPQDKLRRRAWGATGAWSRRRRADGSVAGRLAVRRGPAGFRKIAEIRRMLRDAQPVGQVVYSDGLAAVSVFIEPIAGRADAPPMGLARMGAVNVYTREVADHLVTVVGEAPAASVQRIGNTVEFRPQ
jgi:sigma-E factor negative regulatory protein RseB